MKPKGIKYVGVFKGVEFDSCAPMAPYPGAVAWWDHRSSYDKKIYNGGRPLCHYTKPYDSVAELKEKEGWHSVARNFSIYVSHDGKILWPVEGDDVR